MKRIISVALILIMMLSFVPVMAAETVDLIVSAPASSKVGEIINVNIVLSDYSLACGGSFNVVYDNTKLKLNSVTEGSAFSNINATINDKYSENTVRIIWYGTKTPDGGDIICLEFETIYYGNASISIEKSKLSDLNASPIAHTVTNAKFDIISTICESLDIVGESAISSPTQYMAKVTPSSAICDSIKWNVDTV